MIVISQKIKHKVQIPKQKYFWFGLLRCKVHPRFFPSRFILGSHVKWILLSRQFQFYCFVLILCVYNLKHRNSEFIKSTSNHLQLCLILVGTFSIFGCQKNKQMNDDLNSFFATSHYLLATKLVYMHQMLFRGLIWWHSKWKDNLLQCLSSWLHRRQSSWLGKPILCFLNCGVKILVRFKSGFLECFDSEFWTEITRLRCFRLPNTHQRQIPLALLLHSLRLAVLELMPTGFLLKFKKISSGYEFAELSFRLLLSKPTSVPVLFLANCIHPYSYLVSNASYVTYDHQGSNCTIKFDVRKKTLNILTKSSTFQ